MEILLWSPTLQQIRLLERRMRSPSAPSIPCHSADIPADIYCIMYRSVPWVSGASWVRTRIMEEQMKTKRAVMEKGPRVPC